MNRRVYLAATTALTAGVAGCSAFAGNEPSDDDPEPDDSDSNEPDTRDTLEDDFEDLEAWTVIEGSLSADTTRSRTGSQSALLEDGGANRVRISRTLEESVDASSHVPGLAVAAESTTAPMIHLSDADGNWIEYRQSIRGGTDLIPLNFGITADSGGIDRSAITQVAITMWTGSATNRLWIDGLHLVPSIEESYAMIQFGGGYERVHEVALPRLSAESISAVTFVPTDRIRSTTEAEGERLTDSQLADLADADWTIASQTTLDRPLAGESQRTQESMITDAIEWLDDAGYDPRFLAIPRDAYDDTTLALVTEYHDLGFAGRIPVHGSLENQALVPRVNDPTAEEVVHYLDLVETYGGVASFAYHRLADPATVASLETAVDAIASRRDGGDLDVITPDGLLNFVEDED